MTMTSSQLFNAINTLEQARQAGVQKLREKDVSISDNASIPAIINNISNIYQSTSLNITELVIQGEKIITCADIADTIFELYKDGALVTSSENSDQAYVVAFTIDADGDYTIKALRNSNIVWENTTHVEGPGQYKCLSKYYDEVLGDPVGDYTQVYKQLKYTWQELYIISENRFGDYVFDFDGYEYMQTDFMAHSGTAARAYLVDLDDDDTLIFSFYQFTGSYIMFDTGIGGISWVSCNVRLNCLPNGSMRFIYDETVSSSTSGQYYIYNSDTNTFNAVTLPDAFAAGVKYYRGEDVTEDGAFLASLKSVLGDVNPRVKKIKTWTGYNGSYNTDATIIETQDLIWLPSDANLFGNENRLMNYSKFLQEGKQFRAFSQYKENIFRNTLNKWTRSPAIRVPGNFCVWANNGYMTYSTNRNANIVPLCFSI